MPEPYYCSQDPHNAKEPLAGTAYGAKRVVLLELPHGGWGANPIRNIETSISEKLLSLQSDGFARVLFISLEDDYHAAHPDETRAYIYPEGVTTQTESLNETVDRIVSFGRGNDKGWSRTNRNVFLVCTHGKRDKCCAKYGYPIFQRCRQATREDPRFEHIDVWRVSHLGGDRYAPNALVLPSGHMFGRLELGMEGDLLSSALGTFIRSLWNYYRGNFFLVKEDDIFAECVGKKLQLDNALGGDFEIRSLERNSQEDSLSFKVTFISGEIFYCMARRELFEGLVPDCKAHEKERRIVNARWLLEKAEPAERA